MIPLGVLNDAGGMLGDPCEPEPGLNPAMKGFVLCAAGVAANGLVAASGVEGLAALSTPAPAPAVIRDAV